MLTKDNIKNNTITLDFSKEALIFKDPVKVIDEDWITNKFLTSLVQLDVLEELTLFTSSADRKMTNTALGKSLAINPPYAFTRYTDPPVPGRSSGNTYFKTSNLTQKLGMGTYYSVAIDDNNTTSLLYLTPGVVKFASLISVFVRATDYKTSVVANEGRYPTLYDVGDIIGTIGIGIMFPVRSILIHLVKNVTKSIPFFTDHSFYSIKPTPAQYWMMVQNITNSLASERGVLALNMTPNAERTGARVTYDQNRNKYLHNNFPDIFLKDGGVNVFGVATRAQKNINARISDELTASKKVFVRAPEDVKPVSGKSTLENPPIDEIVTTSEKNEADLNAKYTELPASTLEDFLKDTLDSDLYKEINKSSDQPPKTEEDPPGENPNDFETEGQKLLPSEKSSYIKDFAEAFLTTTQHGADNAVFHVDFVGSTSDTFSNSVKDIPLKDKINSLGGAARDIRFTLAGGNIIDDTVQEVTNGVKDLVVGTASGLSFGLSDLIFGLLEGGYMRFGKMWADSEAQLQSFTFKMRLGGPYNNKISQVIDQDLVIAMLLSLVLPQSTGHGTYTSPLMCKAFMRGVCNLDRAMVTSLSVTKGNGNLGYTKQGKATNLEVSITLTDMSELLVAPLGDAMYNSFNQETALSRYISTLAGRDFRTNTFLFPKLKTTLSNRFKDLESKLSGQSLGIILSDSFIGDLISLPLPDISVATFNESLK